MPVPLKKNRFQVSLSNKHITGRSGVRYQGKTAEIREKTRPTMYKMAQAAKGQSRPREIRAKPRPGSASAAKSRMGQTGGKKSSAYPISAWRKLVAWISCLAAMDCGVGGPKKT